MFFAASKIFWAVFAPSHIIVWCALLAALLLVAGRRRAGTVFAILAVFLLLGLGITPSYVWLGEPLESRYERVQPPAHVDGILVLGGGSEDIHRLPIAYILARRYPQARVVYSSGSGALIDNRPDADAQQAKKFLVALGLDPARLTLEGKSRNTYENLLFSKAMVKPGAGETWILVTSAYHMPRAMQIAEKLGWRLVPWQSDRLTHGLNGWTDVPGNLRSFDMLAHEEIGLTVYRMTGRSSGA